MTGAARGCLREIARQLRHTYRRVRRPTVIRYRHILLPIDYAVYSKSMIEVMYENEYEQEESWIIASLINETDKVLELGAGIGYITTICCKIIKDGHRVHAFEANPELIPIAHKTFLLNRVKPILTAAAITIRKGATDFYLHRDFWLSSTITNETDQSKCITVECLSFSDVIAEIRPTVIICDIEGGEVDLFENADLSFLRAAVVEVHPGIVGRERVRSLTKSLLGAGFFLDATRSLNNVLCFVR